MIVDDGSVVGYSGSFLHPDGTDSTGTHEKAFREVSCMQTGEGEKLHDMMKKTAI